MDDMPRPRPPHLHREQTRHGKVVWVVRIGKGPRTRLRAPYGSPEFTAEYNAAVSGTAPPGKPAAISNASLQWLWDSYRQTGAWTVLKPPTRRQRENIMKHVLSESGAKPYAAIRKGHIVAGLDRRAKTPAAARNFLDTMKGLFRWATERDHIKLDPTAGVDPPKRKKGDGFVPWTESDVEAYQRKWPIGTRQRVWLDVLLYTGLRRGDAVTIGKQHVREGVATIRTEKSGETIEVTIPVLDVLQRTLDAGPTGDLAWICGARGEPFAKESFGNEFSAAARAAGVKKSAHGVRKIAATTAANNGATVHELEAIFGWIGGNMASLYTRKADRVRLAKQAIKKLDGERTSIPAPSGKVRAPVRKD
jgi:integrase